MSVENRFKDFVNEHSSEIAAPYPDRQQDYHKGILAVNGEVLGIPASRIAVVRYKEVGSDAPPDSDPLLTTYRLGFYTSEIALFGYDFTERRSSSDSSFGLLRMVQSSSETAVDAAVVGRTLELIEEAQAAGDLHPVPVYGIAANGEV